MVKPYVNLSIRIREDQLKYLESVSNRSEWLRDAIDFKIASEIGKDKQVDPVLIMRRIESLERQKREILESKTYRRAKRDETKFPYEKFNGTINQLRTISEKPSSRLIVKATGLFVNAKWTYQPRDPQTGAGGEWQEGLIELLPSLDEDIVHTFALERGIEYREEGFNTFYTIWGKMISELADEMMKCHEGDAAMMEALKSKIEQIDSEIDQLKRRTL